MKAVRSRVDFVEVGIEIKARASGTSKALSWKNLRNVAASIGRLWWEVRGKDRPRYRRPGRLLGRV